MGVSAGPKIETGGLVFALDARNIKTFDTPPGITDHGISDWYCFISGTATYSAIYPNTEIIEIDANGVEVGIVTTGSDPQRGSITITAGKRYYGTKAIHILDEGEQDAIAPVSFAGTYFGNRHTRANPKTMNIYAPQDDINVSVYEDVTGGVTGTATSTFSVSRGSSATFVTTLGINVNTIFKTDKPAIMTVGSGSDDHIMQPMSQYVYKRKDANNITINNTTPSNVGTYVSYDTSLPLFTLEIADGAGGDSTQGIGYEYLSDTFSWGNVLSDFVLVSPYADNVVNVSYWLNNQWNLGGSYLLDGTQTSPAGVFRNGNGGFDGAATGTNPYSGAHPNFNTSNLWKFEGTSPFSVIINDNTDDEERLLGWMSNKYLRTSSNVTQSFVNLADKDNRKRMKIYGTTFDSLTSSDFLSFDGVDDHIIIPNNFNDPQQFTFMLWAYPTELNIDGDNNYRRLIIPVGASTNDTQLVLIEQNGNISFRVPGGTADNMNGSGYSGVNQWGHIVCTYDQANKKIYFNGDLKTTTAEASVTVDFGNYLQIVDDVDKTFKGRIAGIKIYNKALTAEEVKRNFNSTRRRFGI